MFINRSFYIHTTASSTSWLATKCVARGRTRTRGEVPCGELDAPAEAEAARWVRVPGDWRELLLGNFRPGSRNPIYSCETASAGLATREKKRLFRTMQRLNEREVEEKRVAMIRQYTIKPTILVKSNTKLRHKDQQDWLRARGKIPAHDLTSTQRDEIRECFRLLDADGSGALDVDELQMAFKVLSMPMTRAAILRLFQAYSGGGDEVDLKAFEKIMAASQDEHAAEGEDEYSGAKRDKNAVNDVLGGEGGGVPLPFNQVATAFRRKKLLELFMEGGHARQEMLDSVEKEKKKMAAEAFTLPALRARMLHSHSTGGGGGARNSDSSSDGKVVSRWHMLDKLEEMSEETWKGKGMLPSQAIHKALGRNHSWDSAQKQVTQAKAAGKDTYAAREHFRSGQMAMYRMSADDRKYAREKDAATRAEREAGERERGDEEKNEKEQDQDGGQKSGSGSGSPREGDTTGGGWSPNLDTPTSLPRLPPLVEEPSLGQVSSASSRSKGKRNNNGFVSVSSRKVPQGQGVSGRRDATRAQSELAKIKKQKGIGEERVRSARRRDRGRGHVHGAMRRVDRTLLHELVRPNVVGGGGGGGDGGSSMVATVARDRAQFTTPSAAGFSRKMPGMS